jgi:aminopeptidase-like protein
MTMTPAGHAAGADPAVHGQPLFDLAKRLWPLNRSISGQGLRSTLEVFRELLPALRIVEVPSGKQVFDWEVPEEWSVTRAWLEGPDGRRVVDFEDDNLHIVGYSEAVDRTLSLEELQPYLHSLPDQPDAIPYVTSYYARTWGFCLTEQQRRGLKPGAYRARIEARHFPGSITLGELILPGKSRREVLLSTYCCHPSMANNELSGPCLLAHLARWLSEREERTWTYRIVFIPEMIGSIAYLHDHLHEMKDRTIAGFNITCVGDERAWSFLPSRHGNTLADKIARHVLRYEVAAFEEYTWIDRGSDESNYCAPGIDLPVASVMRSKYGRYPEYHTSLDTLGGVVTPVGLGQSLMRYQSMLEVLERHCHPVARVLGEPQLGRRGLYPSLSKKGSSAAARRLLDLLSLADGDHSLLDIAERCGTHVRDLFEPLDRLRAVGLLDTTVPILAEP